MNPKFKTAIRALCYGIVDVLIYFVPLVILIIIIRTTGGSEIEILHMPEWWFIILYMLYDMIKDSVDITSTMFDGLDTKMFNSVVVGFILISITFLVLSILLTRTHNVITYTDIIDSYQWWFLIIAILASTCVKSGTHYKKLRKLCNQINI